MPYTTTALFPMMASIPFQAAFGLIFGSNILRLLFPILAAYGAFLLVHNLVQDRVAAFVAGSAFGYSPFMQAHLQGHDFVITGSSWIPWYTLFLIRTFRNVRWSDALFAAAFFWLRCFLSGIMCRFLLSLPAYSACITSLTIEGNHSRGASLSVCSCS